jgi:hypothetical protein
MEPSPSDRRQRGSLPKEAIVGAKRGHRPTGRLDEEGLLGTDLLGARGLAQCKSARRGAQWRGLSPHLEGLLGKRFSCAPCIIGFAGPCDSLFSRMHRMYLFLFYHLTT